MEFVKRAQTHAQFLAISLLSLKKVFLILYDKQGKHPNRGFLSHAQHFEPISNVGHQPQLQSENLKPMSMLVSKAQ